MSILELIKKADSADTCCQECTNENLADVGFDLTEALKSCRVDALDVLRGWSNPSISYPGQARRFKDFIIELFSIEEHEIQ